MSKPRTNRTRNRIASSLAVLIATAGLTFTAPAAHAVNSLDQPVRVSLVRK